MEELDKAEIRKIAYNCRKATFLIEKQQLAEITAREKMELKMHLAGCSVCRIFEEQSLLINKMVKDFFQVNDSDLPELGDEFKKNLKEQIHQWISK